MSSQDDPVGEGYRGSGVITCVSFMLVQATQSEDLMSTNTKLRKVAKKATRMAADAGRKATRVATDAGATAAVLTHTATKAVSAMVKKQQRKRKMAKVKSAAKKVGVGLAAAAAVTGAALAVQRARKPKSRFR